VEALNASDPMLLQEGFTTQYGVKIQLHNGDSIELGPSRVGGRSILISFGKTYHISNSEVLLKVVESMARKP
jgi:hypothetical protein